MKQQFLDVTPLINRLVIEQKLQDKSGVYAYTQRELAYNSNRIEGSKLTKNQTISLFETGTIAPDKDFVRFKDAEEMTGHFVMFNDMLATYSKPLTEDLIKQYHRDLKSGVFEDIANGYPIGEYKSRKNIVSNIETTAPHEVSKEMQELLNSYNALATVSLLDIIKFHVKFERIHPFQDGNGRVGRIIMYKECLKNGIFPFVIEDSRKQEYYNGLNSVENKDDYQLLLALCEEEQQKYYDEVKDFIYEIDKSNEDFEI